MKELSKIEMNSGKDILKSFRMELKGTCARGGLPMESIFFFFLTEVCSTKDLFIPNWMDVESVAAGVQKLEQ